MLKIVLKLKMYLLISILILTTCFVVYGDDEIYEDNVDIIVGESSSSSSLLTVENMIDPDIIQFDKSVRSVDEYTITEWAKNAKVITENDIISFNQPCTWERFCTILWRTNGSPIRSSIDFENTIQQEQESILVWAERVGLVNKKAGKHQMASTMRHGDIQWAFWHLSGEPEPSSNPHSLPAGMHEKAEFWACDIGFIVREEQMTSNPDKMLTVQEAVTYLYYYYHRRAERAFRITVDQFLNQCQIVMDTARINGYIYGDSHAENPTTDGIISCDRLIAKALYDLGYTNQPVGGITCGNADEYLSEWGFERSTSLSSAKRGSIMMVKHTWLSYTSHMFVCASDFDFVTLHCDRYDAGADSLIQSQQPLRNVYFQFKTDDIIIYNIPD